MITKISHYDLLRLPVSRGKKYYVTDLRQLYQDFGSIINERRVLPAMILNTENERATKIRPVQGMNYYVIESNCLWMYDTRWMLKDGNKTYNTYTYGPDNPISPVVLPDEEITTDQGDKIIDNNGLLGDGTVVVRDVNRIQRASIAANNIKKQVEFTSYLENGIMIRPNGLANEYAAKNNIGSLHLGVKMGTWGPEGFERTSYSGHATYKGDFDIQGQLRLVQSTSSFNADIFTVITNTDEESVNYTINCTKTITVHDGTTTYRNFITITPLTETTAEVTVITYSVVESADASDLIPEGDETLIYRKGIKYDAVREALSDKVIYTLMAIGVTITLTPPADGIYNPDTIEVTFSDNSYCDALSTRASLNYMKFWNVSSLLDSYISLSNEVSELKSLVQAQMAKIDELSNKS